MKRRETLAGQQCRKSKRKKIQCSTNALRNGWGRGEVTLRFEHRPDVVESEASFNSLNLYYGGLARDVKMSEAGIRYGKGGLEEGMP
jgi:hypothetical protein